jgi:hypothetical protein
MGRSSGLVRYEVGDPRAVENGRKGGRPRKPRASEVLQARAEAEADTILQPYIEALSARPEDSWSPATKLHFYLRQITVAEKLLDRVFGRPISRDRQQALATHLADPLDDLQPELVVRLVAATAGAADPSGTPMIRQLP